MLLSCFRAEGSFPTEEMAAKVIGVVLNLARSERFSFDAFLRLAEVAPLMRRGLFADYDAIQAGSEDKLRYAYDILTIAEKNGCTAVEKPQ